MRGIRETGPKWRHTIYLSIDDFQMLAIQIAIRFGIGVYRLPVCPGLARSQSNPPREASSTTVGAECLPLD